MAKSHCEYTDPIIQPLKSPIGLPNIGNTCFLNSVIQQLYNMQIFHTVFERNKNKYRNSALNLLRKIFHLMSNKIDFFERQILYQMARMAKFLEGKIGDYKFGKQSDSYETFLYFINQLTQVEPEVMNQLQIGYSLSCKCSFGAMAFNQVKIQSRESKCVNCNQFFSRQITTFPNYLILQGGDESNNYDFIERLNKKKVYYQLMSLNIYVGDGQRGHYYSICCYDHQWYKFDDKNVSKHVELYGKIITSIYRRVDQPSNNQIFQKKEKIQWKRFFENIGTFTVAGLVVVGLSIVGTPPIQVVAFGVVIGTVTILELKRKKRVAKIRQKRGMKRVKDIKQQTKKIDNKRCRLATKSCLHLKTQ